MGVTKISKLSVKILSLKWHVCMAIKSSTIVFVLTVNDRSIISFLRTTFNKFGLALEI